jgi:flagellar hook-associated protein 2
MVGTSSVSGLVSGLDWADVIAKIMEVEHRPIDILDQRQTQYENKLSAWQTLNTKLLSLKTQASQLKAGSAFNLFQYTLTSSSSTEAEDLLAVTTDSDANVGNYTLEISSLAAARKLSSRSFSSKTTALGYSGDIVINGKAVTISTTDTLVDIQSKINNANSGTNATGVTASIVSYSSTDYRLILTSDHTGEDVFQIADASTSDILQSLGFTTSSTSINNPTSDGAKSNTFTSSTTAISSLLGLSTTLSSTTVQIGGNNVSINLDTDSLETIASTIDALDGISASVVTTTVDGQTRYQLDISGTTSFTDSNNILEALGILKGTNGQVNEIHAGSKVNTTDGTTPITATTQFNQIYGANVSLNDTITIQGTKHDGTEISTTYTITDPNTLISDLLTAIENAYGGSSVVDAYISDGTDGNTAGQIVIKDLTAGDSQMSLTLIANNEGGGSLDFGSITAQTKGYSMEVTAGTDAVFKVDGVTMTSSSNTISDIITGVTLDLKKAEAGTSITLNISRDLDAVKELISDFVESYNDVISYINEQYYYDEEEESGGVLMGDGTLLSVQSDIRSIVRDTINGLPSTLNTLAFIGIKTDTDQGGQLVIDDTELTQMLQSDFLGVRQLFIAETTTSNPQVSYVYHTENTQAGTFEINITQAATQATVTGTTDLSGGLSGDETLTITDTISGRVAIISLTSGQSLTSIVNAINSELASEYAQVLTGSVANSKTTAAGGGAISSSTKWSEIDTGGDSNDISNGDTISFSGTTRTGQTVSGTYTITDKDTQTVGGLLAAIESAFNNEVYATIDTSGRIVLTDKYTGDSNLSLTLTEDAGSLDFGSLTVTTEGRSAMDITASASGNYLKITHNIYGSSNGFTISQSSNYTGITDGNYSGLDVAGTINGESATGNGQVLTGNSDQPNIADLSIQYTGTSTGSVGNITLTFGVAEQLNTRLKFITDPYDGTVSNRIDVLQDNIDYLQDRMDEMEKRLERRMEALYNQFIAMETALARMQSLSSWLSQQVGSLNSMWG